MAWKDIERNAVNPIGKRKFDLTVLNGQSSITLALNGLVRGTITKIIFEVPALEGASGTAMLDTACNAQGSGASLMLSASG